MALGEKLEELEPLMFQLLVTRAALKSHQKKKMIYDSLAIFFVFHLCKMVFSTYPLLKAILGEEA